MVKEDVRDERFKINFLGIFIGCIVIIITDQIFNLCNKINFIFICIKSIINICSQLSVSIISAILFYYVVEFVDGKKKMNDFIKIQEHISCILYTHMNILCHTESFEKLNRNELRLKFYRKVFRKEDIPILLDHYKISDKEKIKSEITENMNDIEKSKLIIEFLKDFEKNVEYLKPYKNFSFYKGYKQDIEKLENIYEELHIDIKSYINYRDKNIDITDLDLIDNYINFLNKSINIFHFTEKYILSIQNKIYLEFIKMVN